MSAEDGMTQRLGAYRLLDRIGEGGMGVVFLASGPDGRKVALKVLRSGVADDPTARRRLEREVETMRRVRSPYVAEVVDADLDGHTPYIVTRYVPGRTLDAVVTTGGPLRGAELGRLACGLAEALAAVHAAGVVHRDLKPGNVMMLNGLPVVIDFGIAQGPDATRLTMTGMFMGTPGYLSPEVIEGRPSSEASDVHAWGATVAFAATGRPPFGTGPYETIFYRIVNGQPDLAGAPPAMLPSLASALARDPAHRPTAASLSAQAAALDTDSLTAAPAGAAVPGTPAGAGSGYSTRADMAAGVSAGPAPAAAGADGGGPGQRGHRPPPPGRAGPGGAAGAVMIPRATRPLAGGAAPPDDYADVLPPVVYQPGGSPGNGQAAGDARAGREGLGAAAPGEGGGGAAAGGRGWHPGMVVATMVAAAGASAVFPVAGAAVSLALILLLRAGEMTRRHGTLRRLARGARATDPFLTAVTFPWFLVRAVLASVLIAPFALAVAAAVGGLTFALTPGHLLPRAVACGTGVLVAFYGLGPGSARSRHQLNRVYAAAVRSRLTQAVALAGMTALAAAALAAAVSWPSVYWPAQPPGGLPSFGRLRHLGIAGVLVLLHRHGL